MLVKALSLGYYNERRQKEGSVFKLIDKKQIKMVEKVVKGKKEKVKEVVVIKASAQFSEKWMEKADEKDLDQNLVDHAESVADIAQDVDSKQLSEGKEVI